MVDSTMVVGPDRLHKQMQKASLDVSRDMVESFVAALMSTEADAVCNAQYGVVSDERVNTRNSYRHRDFDTRAGALGVAIPKLRTGSYFPDSENLRGGWLVASDACESCGGNESRRAQQHEANRAKNRRVEIVFSTR